MQAQGQSSEARGKLRRLWPLASGLARSARHSPRGAKGAKARGLVSDAYKTLFTPHGSPLTLIKGLN